jgi:hypothetical protein
MQDQKEQRAKDAVVHYAKAHVVARDRRRDAKTQEEKGEAQRNEFATGRDLDKAVRRLPP